MEEDIYVSEEFKEALDRACLAVHLANPKIPAERVWRLVAWGELEENLVDLFELVLFGGASNER